MDLPMEHRNIDEKSQSLADLDQTLGSSDVLQPKSDGLQTENIVGWFIAQPYSPIFELSVCEAGRTTSRARNAATAQEARYSANSEVMRQGPQSGRP